MELVAHDLVLDVPGQEDGQWQSNLHRAPVEKMELINENSLPGTTTISLLPLNTHSLLFLVNVVNAI